MTDPRTLAEDTLADYRELTDLRYAREVTLARELLKALGERNNALIQARAWRDATERREAERDRLAEALRRTDSYISDNGLSDRSAANSARMVIRAALAALEEKP
jgi:hypothetical protein